MVSKYFKISNKLLGNDSFQSFQLYFCVNSLFLYLLTYYIDKLRRLKIHLPKGEMSLSAEMEIFFTELLFSERMK